MEKAFRVIKTAVIIFGLLFASTYVAANMPALVSQGTTEVYPEPLNSSSILYSSRPTNHSFSTGVRATNPRQAYDGNNNTYSTWYYTRGYPGYGTGDGYFEQTVYSPSASTPRGAIISQVDLSVSYRVLSKATTFGWLNPQNAYADDTAYATTSTHFATSGWKTFNFATGGWTGVDKVEVGLKRKIATGGDTDPDNIVIYLSNDNAATFSSTTYTDVVDDLSEITTWTEVTLAYGWTPAMVSTIAVALQYERVGSAKTISLNHLQVRVTPTGLAAVTKSPTANVAKIGPDATLKLSYLVSPSASETILRGPNIEEVGWYNLTWTNQAEPNGGGWSWEDVSNLKFRFTRADPVQPDSSGNMWIVEVWAKIHYEELPQVHINPRSQAAQPTTVDINVTSVEELYGFEFKLYYNARVLTATGVSLGPFLNDTAGGSANTFGSVIQINDTLGLVWATQTIIGDIEGGRVTAAQWGKLATVSFTQDADGNSNFDLETKLIGFNPVNVVFNYGKLAKTTYPIEHEIVQPVHDVAISSVVPTPNTANQGENITIDADVVNQGDYNETFNVKFYVDTTLIGTEEVTNLNPGANQIVSFEWNTSGWTGKYNLTAVADTLGPPPESDIADNTKLYWPTGLIWIGPDVEVLDVDPDPKRIYSGDPVDINVTVLNKGPNSITFDVKAYRNGIYIDTETVTDLAGDDNTTITIPWDTTGIANGRYILKANTSVITGEIITQNNGYETSTEKQVFVGPDVAVLTVVATAKAYPGLGTVWINATVRNRGSQASTFDVKAFVNRTSTGVINQAGSTYNVVGLAAFTNKQINFTWVTTGFANDTYLAFANVTILTGETETADNTKVDGLIYLGPDIAVTDVTPSPTKAYPGDSVTITVKVKNEGTQQETFQLKAFANLTGTVTQVGTTQSVTLAAAAETTKQFTWATTGYANGTYKVFANATFLTGETDTADNTKIDGNVYLGPDVAVVGLVRSKSFIYEGDTVSIKVSVTNEGAKTETVDAKTFLNRTSTGTITQINVTQLTLTTGQTKESTFAWNSAGFDNDTYVLFSNVTIRTGETDTADNTKIDGTIYIGPDVAASGITYVSKITVYPGEIITARVKVTNKGARTLPSLDVQLYANTTWIMDQTFNNLIAGIARSRTFTWNTLGFPRGNYYLTANISALSGETNTADNSVVYPTMIRVKLLGDIDDDGAVNQLDEALFNDAFDSQEAYKSTPRSPNWNPDADLNGDNFVNAADSSLFESMDHLCRGDINDDGWVDEDDLTLLLQAYGSKPGDPNWDINCDINGDDIVNAPDLWKIGKNWNPPP